MLVLSGPSAYSPFRINTLINDINTAVNSSAVTAIRTVYVHYVNVASGSDLPTNNEKQQVLKALLEYDNAPDMTDALNKVLIQAVESPDDTIELLPNSVYLLRVIPRPGTISPWSSKATNIMHSCGLGDDISRIERGLALVIQVRKGFPFDEHLRSGVFLDFIYDRMTQVGKIRLFNINFSLYSR